MRDYSIQHRLFVTTLSGVLLAACYDMPAERTRSDSQQTLQLGDPDCDAPAGAGAPAPTTPPTPRSTGPGDWKAGDYPEDDDWTGLFPSFLEIKGVAGQKGYTRQYKVHVPPGYQPNKPAPSYFAFTACIRTQSASASTAPGWTRSLMRVVLCSSCHLATTTAGTLAFAVVMRATNGSTMSRCFARCSKRSAHT